MIENDRESRSPPKSSHQHLDEISPRILAVALASPYPVPMRRRSLHDGTRDEILAELDQAGRERTFGALLHGGSTERPERIAEAWREVRDGATWVELDHSVYRVVED